MSDLTEKLSPLVDSFIEDARAKVEMFGGGLLEEGKEYLADALKRIGKYRLKQELESDPNEKAGWEHNVQGVISEAASTTAIKAAETRSFVQGLLAGAADVLKQLIPLL